MSRIGLDLSKFKKIKENKRSAVLQHPEGHQFMIAKNVLSPKMKAELSSLPLHLAEGSDEPVRSPDEQNASYDPSLQKPDSSSADNVQQPNASYQPQPNIVINNTPPPAQPPAPQQVAQAQPAQDQRFNPVNQTSPVSNQPPPQNDPYGSTAYGNISKEGLKNQIEGINETATAQGAQNQAVAQEQSAGAVAQQQQLDNVNSHVNDMRNEYHNFIQDYQNQHIDPQHYFNTLGVGGNIATGIGLILGGMGGGLTHQGNPAMDFLNKQIDRDVDAQRAEMGKKQNLLSANMQQFRNEVDASTMTSAMLRGIVANKMEAAALKTGNPLLIARAKQASGQLELQNNQLFSQIAIRKTLEGGNKLNSAQTNSNGDQSSQIDPALKIRLLTMAGQLTPEQSAQATKELKEAEDMKNFRDNALNAFDKIAATNTLWNNIRHPIDASRQTDAYLAPLQGSITKEIEGRVTPTDMATIRPLFHKAGSGAETDAISRQQLDNLIRQKMNFPHLKAIQIEMGPNGINTSVGNNKVSESAPILK